MSTFKLVVNGELLAGHAPEEVRAKIAKLLKFEADSEQIELIFSGNTVALQKGLSQAQAEKYGALIRAAGLACEVVAEQDEADVEPSAQQFETESEPETIVAQEAYDPYQQAQAELNVAPEPDEFDLVEPKKLGAGAGWAWFKEGFHYFKMSPGLWIGAVLLFWLITIVVSMIPFVSIVLNIFMPVFMAGFMLAAYKQSQGEGFSLGDIFAGFKNNTGNLLAVGALYFLGMIICMLMAFAAMFLVMGGFEGMASMSETGAPPDPLLFALVMLIMFALFMPLMMAYWFAPALVMLNDVGPVQAMRLSLKGCLRNWLPFLLYGLIGFVLMIIAMLPLMLGLLVLAPVGMASIFAAYRQIYTNT